MQFLKSLQKVPPLTLWLLAIASSALMTYIIVSGMAWLLEGKVNFGYILTAFVASFSVNGTIIGILTFIFSQLREAAEQQQVLVEKLKKSQQQAEMALSASHSAVWDYSLESGKVRFSEGWSQILGGETEPSETTPDELLGRFLPEERKTVRTAFIRALRKKAGDSYNIEQMVRKNDGDYIWIVGEGRVVERDATGRPLRMLGIARDISDRKRAENEVRIAATAFDSQEGMLITDSNATIQRVNNAFTRITGFSAEEIVGQNPRVLSSGRQSKEFYTNMWRELSRTGVWSGEIWNRRKNGEIYPEYLSITAVRDRSGSITNYVASMSDITLRKKSEEEIQRLAYYDHLTGLPNRRLLMERLQQALVSSGRRKWGGALLFIDLDNFKTLNDTQGHSIGDYLLQQVAQRLTACVREGDSVARLGGDEFVIMLVELNDELPEASMQAMTIGEKIITSLGRSYRIGDHEHVCTASIGITLFQGRERKCEVLLRQADIAMYQAKHAGRNTLRFFDQAMQESINIRAAMEGELRKALDRRQFSLYYQAQVDAKGRVEGVEALLRWQHPEYGMVSPAKFIPLAEETGLIGQIGLWVLDTACAQLAKWKQNEKFHNLSIAVNISAEQFHLPDFVYMVKETVRRHDINATRLKLELTESLAIENIESTVEKMEILKEVGISFSLDDFGTGYSSLAHLKRLSLDQIKIDQSFVRNILRDNADKVMVMAITSLGMNFELHIIAEGVETQEQFRLLHRCGCESFQGYLFSKPVPVDEFEAWVMNRPDTHATSEIKMHAQGTPPKQFFN